jgi:hypothetical protein
MSRCSCYIRTLTLHKGGEIEDIVIDLLSRQIMCDPGVTLFLQEKSGKCNTVVLLTAIFGDIPKILDGNI